MREVGKGGGFGPWRSHPALGPRDVPGLPHARPRARSSSAPSSPLASQNAAGDSAELGDTGERGWGLSLALPSAEAKGTGAWRTHQTPPWAVAQAHQHTSKAFKH